MSPTDFLNLEERVQYLYDKQYFDQGTISSAHKARLAEMNFHYFLGYARNYRALAGRDQFPIQQKMPDDVFDVIDMDARVAALLHPALRTAEWRLRSITVQHYCAKFQDPGSYLQTQQYRATEPNSEQQTVEALLACIFRHDEPYVQDFLQSTAQKKSVALPRRYEPQNHARCASLAAGLPLWTVVDSFSLGLLSRFIMTCDTDTNSPVWKDIASDLAIGNSVLETQLKSLTYLRNTVAHHARLWMRPTADSPKKPKKFDKQLRGSHNKSMYWAFLNLAAFLPPNQQLPFVQQVDHLTTSNALYRQGITQVFTAPKST